MSILSEQELGNVWFGKNRLQRDSPVLKGLFTQRIHILNFAHRCVWAKYETASQHLEIETKTIYDLGFFLFSHMSLLVRGVIKALLSIYGGAIVRTWDVKKTSRRFSERFMCVQHTSSAQGDEVLISASMLVSRDGIYQKAVFRNKMK